MLPMAQAPLLVCSVLSLVWHWNDYFEPGVYITAPAYRMLPSVLPNLYALLNQENHTMIQVNELEGIVFNGPCSWPPPSCVSCPSWSPTSFCSAGLWRA